MVLSPDSARTNSYLDDATYYGYRADEIAGMRAQLILLDKKPELQGGGRLQDDVIRAHIYGRSDEIKIEDGLIPKIWNVNKRRKDVLRFIRLWAVFYLKATGTCKHILELTLTQKSSKIIEVKFKAKRKKIYSNAEAPIIEFKGSCKLS